MTHRTSMRPRFVLIASFLFCVATGLSAAESVTIKRVWVDYKDEKSFVRLGEYFSGKEKPGKAQILRSHPTQRSGLYFTLRLRSNAGTRLSDGRIVLQVIAPDADKPQVFNFPFKSGSRRSLLLKVGLTGSDWTFGDTLPLAWKLEIVGDASDAVLTSRQSFLWEKPAESS